MSVHPIEALEANLPPGRRLRVVACIDVVKAAVALLAGYGLLGARDSILEASGRSLLRLLTLDPSRGLAMDFVELMHAADRNHGMLASLAGAYAALRLAEAYGLWGGHGWARWLGLATAGVYIPFEFAYLVHHPDLAGATVLAVNLAVLWLLWPRRA